MTGPTTPRGFDWDAAGRELGETLGEYNVLVVVGLDPVATGRVAVAIARAQANYRRVAVGDLFAESPPIQELVHTDDPHGIVDSFLYGVSLSKIAREVPGAGQLYVMPSGSEAPTYEEILPNPRWHRLSAGFREMHAMLVLAAPATAPHIDKLVAATDGAIVVGDAVPSQIPAARIVASVREQRPRNASPIVGVPRVEHQGWSKRRLAAFAGIGLTLAAAGVAAWLAYRPLAGNDPRPRCARGASRDSSCHAHPTNVLALAPDSARKDTSHPVARAPDSAAVPAVDPAPFPVVANPRDSSVAVPFAVQLMAANTEAGAILKLQKDGKVLPAATFAPAIIQGARWFKVVSGAFATHVEADSLLTRLRQQRRLLGSESVVRLPFAFLIDSVPATAVPGLLSAYADHGQPVYALRQPSGFAWLLVGAYESPEQASLYVESLRASGKTPVLVYRKGRSF